MQMSAWWFGWFFFGFPNGVPSFIFPALHFLSPLYERHQFSRRKKFVNLEIHIYQERGKAKFSRTIFPKVFNSMIYYQWKWQKQLDETWQRYLVWEIEGKVANFFIYFFGGFFLFFSCYIQHCFICRPSDYTVPTDAGIEPRTVATGALTVRRSNH
jgi:hypothetical protein